MEIDDSVLDETVDGVLEGDGDDSILDRDPDVPSEESSSPSDGGVEIKIDEESNDTLDAAVSGEAKKDSKGGIASHKKSPFKRSTRSRAKKNDTDDENEEEERDEEVEDEHKAMLTSADRKIQVGDEFQAKVDEPQKDQEETIMSDDDDRDQVMWRAPSRGFDEQRLMEYCEDAIGVYKLTYDRALFILQNCQYNVDRALEKIKKRRLVVEEWGDDDRILFKQAFHMFGKNFSKIRQTMPHRSMASIIQFYYNTKKEHDYKSLLDSKLADDSDDGGGSDDELEYEEGACDNCGELANRLHLIDENKLCYACKMYYKLMHKHRPCNHVVTLNENRQRRIVKCPDDMYDIAVEFKEMSENVGDSLDDEELREVRRERRMKCVASVGDGIEVIQQTKSRCYAAMKSVERELTRVRSRAIRLECALKVQRAEGLGEGVNSFRTLVVKDEKRDEDGGGGGGSRRERVRYAYSWTENEKITAFHCLLRYGRDFEAVAEVLGTKTPDMVKSFYSELKPEIDKILEQSEKNNADLLKKINLETELQVENRTPVEVVDLD